MRRTLASVLSDSSRVSWFSYGTPFWVIGALFMICAFIVLAKFEHKLIIKKSAQKTKGMFEDLLKTLKIPTVSPLLLISILSMLGWMTYQGFVSPYLDQKYGFSEDWIAKAFTSFCAFWLIGGLLANQWLLKKYHSSRVNMLPMALTPFCVLSYQFFPQSAGMWYASAAANLFMAISTACFFALFSVLSPPSIQGKVFGFWNAGFALCSGFGPILAGVMAVWSIDLPFFAASVFLFIATLFYFRWFANHKQEIRARYY